MASAVQIVDRCKRGESAAFAELVAAHQDAVYTVAFCNTGDPVLSEDITQDTFLQAWRGLHSLRDPQRVRPWLCGVARNLARNAQRKRSREVFSPELDEVDVRPDPREAAMTIEAQRMIADALDQVSVAHREALLLYYQMGKSAREVAETLGVSEAVVLQRLHRGRRELKRTVFRRVEAGLAKLRPTAGLSAAVMAAVSVTRPASAAAATRASVEAKGATSMTTTIKICAALAAAAIAGVAVWAGVSHGTSPSSNAAVPVLGAASAAPGTTDSNTPPPFSIKQRPQLDDTASSAAEPVAAAKPAPTPPVAAAKPRPSLAVAPTPNVALMRKLGLYRGPSRGPDNAPITMVVFTDFHCLYCGRVLGTIDQLLDEYKGKLRVVSKMFPVKPGSKQLARAATAAGRQGKFWQMTDLLYANQDKPMPDKAQLIAYAKQLGLDTVAFARAYESPGVKHDVMQQIEAGRKLGVHGTPTVFINGKKVIGAQPIANFRTVIDATLKP